MQKINNYLFFLFYLLSRPKLFLLINKVYLPIYIQFEWLKDYNIKTVIDIGAYHGDVSKALLTILPNVDVYAFEANDAECATIEKRIQSKKFILNNIALSNKVGKANFYITNYSPTSSLLPLSKKKHEQFKNIQVSEKITVDTTTLDKYFEKKKLKGKIFMKIDVQGAEKLVFSGGKEFLKKVDIIHIEASYKPFYENQCYFEDVYTLLKNLGFKYAGSVSDSDFYPFFHPTTQENCIFIRE